MPSSTITRFSDPYDYGKFRQADVEIVVTAPGECCGELMRIDLHQLEIHRGWISLPRISYAAHKKDWCNITFHTDVHHAPTMLNGMEAPSGRIAIVSPGAEVYHRSSTECFWGAASLTTENLARAAQTLLGYELMPTATELIRPPPHLMSRLLNLHQAAGDLAATAPDILAHPEVARAIEQGLMRVIVACLTVGQRANRDRVRHTRVSVMRRFEELLEANQDQPLYIPELCAELGVSDRTLRSQCQEHLGMSPHRYLWLRRMHLVRRALSRADPRTMTVTGIANDYGFGELGRFAVAYKGQFGESPSTTLHRAPRTSCMRGNR